MDPADFALYGIGSVAFAMALLIVAIAVFFFKESK